MTRIRLKCVALARRLKPALLLATAAMLPLLVAACETHSHIHLPS